MPLSNWLRDPSDRARTFVPERGFAELEVCGKSFMYRGQIFLHTGHRHRIKAPRSLRQYLLVPLYLPPKMKTTIPTRPVASRYVNSAQCTSHRHFSTTSPHAVYVKHALRRVLPKDRSEIPHYPYGPSRLFKQSNKGIRLFVFVLTGSEWYLNSF